MTRLMNATEIMEMIPNRYPICFIDYVDEIIPEKKSLQPKTLRSMKNFSKDISLEIQQCQVF